MERVNRPSLCGHWQNNAYLFFYPLDPQSAYSANLLGHYLHSHIHHRQLQNRPPAASFEQSIDSPFRQPRHRYPRQQTTIIVIIIVTSDISVPITLKLFKRSALLAFKEFKAFRLSIFWREGRRETRWARKILWMDGSDLKARFEELLQKYNWTEKDLKPKKKVCYW